MYIVMVGCGRVGAELARLLSLGGNDVVVIDQNESAFARLGEAFNGITIKGNGVSTKILQDAGIERTDVFCSLTNSDNINIMASQVARGIFKVPRVIARVYDPRKAAIYKTLGLDILSETTLFASMIRDKIADKMLSSYLIESGHMGVLEIPVDETNEKIFGKTVADINIPGELVVTAIRHGNSPPIIPEPTATFKKSDILVAVIKMKSLPRIKKLFNL